MSDILSVSMQNVMHLGESELRKEDPGFGLTQV